MASRAWIAAALLAIGCQSAGEPTITDVNPAAGDIASAVAVTITGANLVPAVGYDVDSGEAAGSAGLEVQLVAGSLVVDPVEVVPQPDGSLQIAVPVGLVPGTYDVVVRTGRGEARASAAYLAQGALAVMPVLVGVGPNTGRVILVDGSGQMFTNYMWSLSADIAPDVTVDELTTPTTTMDPGAGFAPVGFTHTLAETVTIDLASITIDGQTASTGVTVTPGVWALTPGPAALVRMVSGTDTDDDIDLPVQVTDQYGNPQPNHGGIDVTWMVTQSFFPSQINAGIDQGSFSIADGVVEGTINFSGITERGAAEIQIAPNAGTGCDGVLCFLPFGACPNPLPVACTCTAPNCL